MDNLSDIYISQCLKNWAASEQPPNNIRSRLLLKAASASLHDESFASPDASFAYPSYRQSAGSLFPIPTGGSFYQPLLWVLHLNLTPIKNIA
jgi:hypothetical protein